MDLQKIAIAVDDMEEWSVKINAGFDLGDDHTAAIANLDGEMDAAEGRLGTLEGEMDAVETLAGDNATDIATNVGDIATNTGGIANIVSGATTLTKVQLDTAGGQTHSPGQISYDAVSKTGLMDTGFADVRVNMGQEMQVRFYNDTGAIIPNGTVINGTGVHVAANLIKGYPADTESALSSSVILGVATHEVGIGEVGIATQFGEIHGLDTSTGGFTAGGVLYADGGAEAGKWTETRPRYPDTIIILGTVLTVHATEGVLFVNTQRYNRSSSSRSYAFSQANLLPELYYIGGFYDAPGGAVNFVNGGTESTVFGAANIAYGAHYFIVAGPGADVDTGGPAVVALQITGNAWRDDVGTGTPISNPTTEILVGTGSTSGVASIADLIDGQYVESDLKWNGQVTVELINESAAATTYNVDFNHGWAKYEDLNNRDFSLTGVEFVGRSNSATSGFEIKVYHHNGEGWEFDDGGFVPGGIIYASWQEQLTPDFEIGATGTPFAWKRAGGGGFFIEGSKSEGIVISVDCPASNSISYMNAHISGVIESLS